MNFVPLVEKNEKIWLITNLQNTTIKILIFLYFNLFDYFK